MTSVWAAVPRQETQPNAWPVATSCLKTPAWTVAPRATTRSRDGNACPLSSARTSTISAETRVAIATSTSFTTGHVSQNARLDTPP